VPPVAPGTTDTAGPLGTPPAGGPAADMTGGAGAGGFDVAGRGGAGGAAVGGGSFTGSGYVEPAIPVTMYRLRVDDALDDNRCDRADFIYSNRTLSPSGRVPLSIDLQELSNYFELALCPRFSVWVDVPVRWVDFHVNNPGAIETASGLSDVQFGFKYAFVYTPWEVATFQFRTFAPTGNTSQGLGRGNWNLEPALLYYRRLTQRLFFEGEIKDFIPVAAGDTFAGNVATYGGSLSYLLYDRPNVRVAPVTELVGWTVFTGKETADGQAVSAAGDTIINAKFGVRTGFGELVQPGFLSRADVYLGYGRALTGEVWYKNLFRAEFRLRF
jgi:hypothetical protein